MEQRKFLIFFIVISSCFADDKEHNKYCETLKHCEHDSDYPQHLLNQLDLWKYQFNRDEHYYESEIESLRNKRSVDTKGDTNQFLIETKLCESTISFARPRRLKNLNNQFRTIVNHQNYTQVIRQEECLSVNFPCTWNIYPKLVRSFCRQNEITQRLWALDEQRNCLVMDKFVIPVACDCIIEKEDVFRGVKKNLLQQRP